MSDAQTQIVYSMLLRPIPNTNGRAGEAWTFPLWTTDTVIFTTATSGFVRTDTVLPRTR